MSFVSKSKAKFAPKIKRRTQPPKPSPASSQASSSQGPSQAPPKGSPRPSVPEVESPQARLSDSISATPLQSVEPVNKEPSPLSAAPPTPPATQPATQTSTDKGSQKLLTKPNLAVNSKKSAAIMSGSDKNQQDALSSIKLMSNLSRRSSISNTAGPGAGGFRTRRLSSISRSDKKLLGKLISEKSSSESPVAASIAPASASPIVKKEPSSQPINPIPTSRPMTIQKAKKKKAISNNFSDVKGQLKKPGASAGVAVAAMKVGVSKLGPQRPPKATIRAPRGMTSIRIPSVVAAREPAVASSSSASDAGGYASDATKKSETPEVDFEATGVSEIQFIPIMKRKRGAKAGARDNEEDDDNTPLGKKKRHDATEAPETDEVGKEGEEGTEDLDLPPETTLILDQKSNKVKQISTKDYEKFKDQLGSEFKVSSIKQLPRGSSALHAKLFENFVLDEESFTIADLCSPQLPIGQVSSDFQLARAGARKRKQAAKERAALRIEARKRGKLYQDLLKEGETAEERAEKRKKQDIFEQVEEQSAPVARNLQFQVIDGQISVNAESQIIDSRENLVDTDRIRVVENENPYENPIHSRSFSKHEYADRWTFEETCYFYKALVTWGTDFAIISQLFPHRTRRQVKKKFTLEEKKNLHLVNMALQQKLPPSFNEYVEEMNRRKDASEKMKFQSLEEFNKELEAEKEKHEQTLDSIEKEKEKAQQDDLVELKKKEEERRKIDEMVASGELRLSRKEQIERLRAKEEVVGEIGDIKTPLPQLQNRSVY